MVVKDFVGYSVFMFIVGTLAGAAICSIGREYTEAGFREVYKVSYPLDWSMMPPPSTIVQMRIKEGSK